MTWSNWDLTLIFRAWLWLGKQQHIKLLLKIHIYQPEFCWAGRLPSSILTPHSAGDLAAEIISCFSCYSSQALWRILWEGIYSSFLFGNLIEECLFIPLCLGHCLLNWSTESQCSYISEAIKLHRANSDFSKTHWGVSFGEKLGSSMYWKHEGSWKYGDSWGGCGGYSRPTCLKVAQPFSSYLADQFFSPLRGVQTGANQSFPVCRRYKYHLPAPWAQK